MTPLFRYSPRAAVACALLTLFVGCGSDVTAPRSESAAGSVIVATRDASQPALFIQRVDGTHRQRLHLQNVRDQIPGNDASLHVSDDALLALASPRWNAAGTRVAVVATSAYDQSAIVILDRDGNNAEIASPNTQIIASVPQWSPDGQSLAYMMTTLPNFGGIDLFVTSLATHTVLRLTTGAHMGRSVIRWDVLGHAIYFTRVTGETNDPVTNVLTQIVRVNVETGEQHVVRSGILGEVQAISQYGTNAVVLRNRALVGSTYQRDLVQVQLASAAEQIIIPSEPFLRASYSPTEMQLLLASAPAASSSGPKYEFWSVATRQRVLLGNIQSDADLDLYVPLPPD